MSKRFYELDNLTKYLLTRLVELNYEMSEEDINISKYERLYIKRQEIIKALRESEYDVDEFVSIMKSSNAYY